MKFIISSTFAKLSINFILFSFHHIKNFLMKRQDEQQEEEET
jgi:hypothetical protein